MIYKVLMSVIIGLVAIYNLATIIFGARRPKERYPRLKGLCGFVACVAIIWSAW